MTFSEPGIIAAYWQDLDERTTGDRAALVTRVRRIAHEDMMTNEEYEG